LDGALSNRIRDSFIQSRGELPRGVMKMVILPARMIGELRKYEGGLLLLRAQYRIGKLGHFTKLTIGFINEISTLGWVNII
jgi:hypothetical protein